MKSQLLDVTLANKTFHRLVPSPPRSPPATATTSMKDGTSLRSLCVLQEGCVQHGSNQRLQGGGQGPLPALLQTWEGAPRRVAEPRAQAPSLGRGCVYIL